MSFTVFPLCSAGSLCSSCAVYAVSCINGNKVPGLATNHPRRALACGVCFVRRSRVCPSPPPPGGSGKTGRLSGDSPCVTTHSLLRLPAKHRPTQRTGNARSVCSTTERVFRVRLPRHVLERGFSSLTGANAFLPSERLAFAKSSVEFAESAGKRICVSVVSGRCSQS